MKGRDWFRVHSWVGVVGGLLLFVICWSGTVATVSYEIDWLLDPALRVDAVGEPASWGTIHEAVQAAHPDATIEWMHAPRHRGFAVEAVIKTPAAQRLRVHVDPSTAVVQGQSTFFNVQRFFRSFHMGLFLTYPVGTYLVGSFSVLLLVSTLAPLLFYKRWWTRFFRLRHGRGARALWSELHKLAGLWSLWFGFIIAVTGIWYLAEQTSVDLADAQFAYPPSPEWRVPADATRLPLDALVARAQALRPELEIRSISFGYSDSTQAVLFSGQAGHVLVRDRANKLFLDPLSADVVLDQSADDLGLFLRWVDTADPLHFGDFGGLLSQFVWFVFGLLLSALCLTGAWLHAARLLRESRTRRAHWPGTAAAVLVSLLVLAASAAGGWREIRNYGALVDGVRLWPEVPGAVIAFLFGWLLLTLATLWFWLRLLTLVRSSEPARSQGLAADHSFH
jgi:uncharacterized iron-regulated membrane protein